MPTDKGANAGGKVTALVAGMLAGADSIDDMALLRHRAMGKLFDQRYAPSTLGSFLRDNALDATLAGLPHRRVEVSFVPRERRRRALADNRPGPPDEQRGLAFTRGWSTKADTSRAALSPAAWCSTCSSRSSSPT